MTRQVFFEQPPDSTPPDLAAWLERQILQIQDAFEQRLDLDSERSLDDGKVADGMFRYSNNGPEGPGFYGRIAGAWVKFGITGDVLIGTYDQTTDTVSGGTYDGLALPAASTLQDRQYMTLTANGAFITSEPDLVGKTGSVADTIMVFDGEWVHFDVGSAYLSAIVDDTAQGDITLAKTPTANNHASRLQQVTNGDQNTLASANAYTDAHAALQTNPDDVHGSKTYTDAEIADLAAAILANFVSIGYGGLAQTTNPSSPNIGAGWVTLPFSEEATSNPRNVIQNPVNNTLSITQFGTYFMSLSLSVAHNESNQGRETFLRLYNVTKDAPADIDISVGVARNQPASVFTWTFLFDLPIELLGDEFRWEVGGGSSITVNEWSGIEWSIFHISEFKGILT